MSLYKPSSGILETHVTWEDVEEEMQKSLGTEAVFGANKKATNIGDMKGFMSRIALIEPDWSGAKEDEKLPEKFAVKISSQIAHVNLAAILGSEQFSEEKLEGLSKFTRQFHNQEVQAYKHLMDFNHPDIPFTKVYALKPFASETDLKAYIILDFVQNVRSMGMHESIPAEDLKQLIRGVATFSALGQTLTTEDRAKFGGPETMKNAFDEFFGDDQLDKMFGSLATIFGKDNEELLDKVVPILRHYMGMVKKFENIAENLGFKLVLNHCDCWQANMLHSLRDDGTLKLEAIIDWQCVSRGIAGGDMARVLVCCLTAKDRREQGSALLEFYYRTFTDVYGEEYFTLEELHDAYNIQFPLLAMIVAPMIMPFLDKTQVSGDDKEKFRQENMTKLVALMEDVISVHEQNLRKFPEFMTA